MRTLILPLLFLSVACTQTGSDGGSDSECNDDPYKCDGDSDGQTPAQGDCNDSNPDVFMGADEYCNGIDDDCDGETDEKGAVDSVVWYFDDDGDGFGNEKAAQRGCEPPSSKFVTDGTDCDDDNANASPSGTEDCTDGADNDCNGLEDCEEATCSDLHVCDEVSCNNRIDDDDDGLVDCDDDGCWGMPACADEVRTIINGGNVQTFVRNVFLDGAQYNNFHRLLGFQFATSVTGSIQARFSDHTVSCTWALSGASIYGASRRSSDGIEVSSTFSPVDANRGAISVNGDGCTYFGTSVLPPEDDWFVGLRPYRSTGGASPDALIAERATDWDSFDVPTRIVPFYVGDISKTVLSLDTHYTVSGIAVDATYGWIYADLKPWAPNTFVP